MLKIYPMKTVNIRPNDKHKVGIIRKKIKKITCMIYHAREQYFNNAKKIQ